MTAKPAARKPAAKRARDPFKVLAAAVKAIEAAELVMFDTLGPFDDARAAALADAQRRVEECGKRLQITRSNR